MTLGYKVVSQNSAMITETAYSRFPRVQIWRRGVAFGIDFLGVWLLSSLLAGNTFAFVVIFGLIWLGERVFLVYRNHGQSLGRYALDMKVLDPDLGKVPGLQILAKREAIVGCCALLAGIAFNNFLTDAGIVLLLIPLAIDCGLALSDPQGRQAIHDRLARTIIISTHRGYSLDLKVKRLVAQVRSRVRR